MKRFSRRLPRLVHFTFPPGVRLGALPVLTWEAALSGWRRWFPTRNGSFRHYFWSDANLSACLRAEFPEYAAAFLSDLPGGVERADVGRYCVLYRYGGIYADMDYEPRSSFFGVLARGGLASLLESPYRELGEMVQNSLMASPPGHALWKLVLHSIFSSRGPHHWDDVASGTGPRMLSRLLRSMPPSVRARVRILPCAEYQRAVEDGSGTAHCSTVASSGSIAQQRGIHWGTMSHASFAGVALRAEAFFEVHPRLKALRRGQLFRHARDLEAAESAAAAGSAVQTARAILQTCLLQSDQHSECPGDAAWVAEKLLRNALTLTDARRTVVLARYLLGSALQSVGRLPEAAVEFHAALQLDPSLEAAAAGFSQVAEDLGLTA